MKNYFLKFAFLTAAIFLSSCSKDDNSTTPVSVALETQTASNIPAPQTGGSGRPTAGPFTRFSFAKNAVVTDNSWDIAFRGTTILVNGGATIGIADEPLRTGIGAISIQTGIFSNITAIPVATTFVQDGANSYAIPTGSNNGWFSYNQATNLISPIAGKIFVVKTHDGKFAKFEILSYYLNAPVTPDPSLGRFYTFKFVYQANSNTSF